MGFLSGIFSSKQTSQNIYRDDELIESSDEGLTGVAKYLNAQSSHPVEHQSYAKKLSGVEKYVNTHNASAIELTDDEKGAINTRIHAAIELRKKEEILMSEELSGVARYVESQEQASIAAQNKIVPATGVAKYLANVIANKPAVTGVSKYLHNRSDVKVSSVDRYVINKSLADKNKPEVIIIPPSSVSKYLANRPTLLTSSVAKYIAKQRVASKQVVA